MKEQKKFCIVSDKNKLILCLEELKNGIFNGDFNESHLINLCSAISRIIKQVEGIELKKQILEVKLAAENELTKLHEQML